MAKRERLNGKTKAKGKAKPEAKADKKPKVWKRTHPFVPNFCFKSFAHADRERIANARRSGMVTSALTVLEQDGMFAIVPAWKKGMPVPQFKKGDIVYGLYRIDGEAKVVGPGPEQTVIRYTKESVRKARPKEECVPNQYLFARKDVQAADSKRERL